MASKVQKMWEIQFKDEQTGLLVTMIVPLEIHDRLNQDMVLAQMVYQKIMTLYAPLQEDKILDFQESLDILGGMNLLKNFADAARGQGVSLGPKAIFDSVSQECYTRSETLSDVEMFAMARAAPKHLTAAEKVRFMELLTASAPGPSTSTGGFTMPSPNIPEGGGEEPSTLDLELTEDDDTDMDFREALSPIPSTSGSQLDSQAADTVRSQWNEPQVMLLLNLRKEHEEMFSNSCITQKQCWRKISEEMKKKGYNFSGDDCFKKFHSLRSRHKIIKDRNKRTGCSRQTWKYLDIMDDMFGKDPAVTPSLVIGSLVPDENTKDISSERQLPPPPPTSPANPSPVTPVRKGKRRRSSRETTPVLGQMHQERIQEERRRTDLMLQIEQQKLDLLKQQMELDREEQRRRTDVLARFGEQTVRAIQRVAEAVENQNRA